MTDHFTLDSARAAAATDEIARWVGDFLASRGSDNATLAAGLAQRPHWWWGPGRLPLADLVPLAGPEGEAPIPIPPQEWNEDVEEMEGSIDEGWTPPPLLAEFRDGALLLQDGNHRAEALMRAGEEQAWAIVWFDDEHAREQFARAHGEPTGRVPAG
jgi:hypothetical protein